MTTKFLGYVGGASYVERLAMMVAECAMMSWDHSELKSYLAPFGAGAGVGGGASVQWPHPRPICTTSELDQMRVRSQIDQIHRYDIESDQLQKFFSGWYRRGSTIDLAITSSRR